jgi:hypothetical protein
MRTEIYHREYIFVMIGRSLKCIFGYTPKRAQMILGMEDAMASLKAAGCRTFYINGSFVTSKLDPRDFDCCWDRDDTDIDYLRKTAPIILKFHDSAAQKNKYKGEIYPSEQSVDESTMSIEFFQRDRDQNRKGIIAINLLEWEP